MSAAIGPDEEALEVFRKADLLEKYEVPEEEAEEPEPTWYQRNATKIVLAAILLTAPLDTYIVAHGLQAHAPSHFTVTQVGSICENC